MSNSIWSSILGGTSGTSGTSGVSRGSTSSLWSTVRVRRMGNLPFQDDLTPADLDDFGLSDFQQYKESPELGNVQRVQEGERQNRGELDKGESLGGLKEWATMEHPVVVISKLSDPFVNLAIEDYVYNKMPLPDKHTNYNRLMFYTNSACVVIGKNQNPWKEVNLPVLNSLQIPLVRRRSGGGTVVHDHGNVNFSFMTTKGNFDRFKFAELIKNAVNGCEDAKYRLEVNSRGDITTEKQRDGINYKISGSAYKLSKGRSYHHGTMLLNSRLDVLGQLLSRDETKLGKVVSSASIDSVKSKVANLELAAEKFIEVVSREFEKEYGVVSEGESESGEQQEGYDHNELFGLSDFMGQGQRTARVVTIDSNTSLPQEIIDTSKELSRWQWRYGSTHKFSHALTNEKLNFSVTFNVGKGAILEGFELQFGDGPHMVSPEKITDSFEFLREHVGRNKLEYTGSNVAGFITHDMISDWVGHSIDGTI